MRFVLHGPNDLWLDDAVRIGNAWIHGVAAKPDGINMHGPLKADPKLSLHTDARRQWNNQACKRKIPRRREQLKETKNRKDITPYTKASFGRLSRHLPHATYLPKGSGKRGRTVKQKLHHNNVLGPRQTNAPS